MQIENISKGKVIGMGSEIVLPGETKDIPFAFENNPTLKMYERMGFARIIGAVSVPAKSEAEIAAEKAASEKKAEEDAEVLRQARLASLSSISEEALGKLANELGVNPAECKDSADVMKKVKAALKK